MLISKPRSDRCVYIMSPYKPTHRVTIKRPSQCGLAFTYVTVFGLKLNVSPVYIDLLSSYISTHFRRMYHGLFTSYTLFFLEFFVAFVYSWKSRILREELSLFISMVGRVPVVEFDSLVGETWGLSKVTLGAWVII